MNYIKDKYKHLIPTCFSTSKNNNFNKSSSKHKTGKNKKSKQYKRYKHSDKHSSKKWKK